MDIGRLGRVDEPVPVFVRAMRVVDMLVHDGHLHLLSVDRGAHGWMDGRRVGLLRGGTCRAHQKHDGGGQAGQIQFSHDVILLVKMVVEDPLLMKSRHKYHRRCKSTNKCAAKVRISE